jgi:lipopolysaccharide/colanic/teichoic acid biosynthesis glycosyltransferase
MSIQAGVGRWPHGRAESASTSVVSERIVLRRGGAWAKRGFDVAVAGVLLVLLAPVLAALALLVVLDSPGPAFYRCERVGYRGRPLRMLKFRKMVFDAAGGPLTKADDDRFTRLGRWLARYKLDELPQLWHVVRGEMSLVGPRPECAEFVRAYAADYHGAILRTRPGIFGYSQLAFADESAILDRLDPIGHYVARILPQKVRLDVMYASAPGLARDLRVLLWSAVAVLLRRPVAVARQSGSLTLRRR